MARTYVRARLMVEGSPRGRCNWRGFLWRGVACVSTAEAEFSALADAFTAPPLRDQVRATGAAGMLPLLLAPRCDGGLSELLF